MLLAAVATGAGYLTHSLAMKDEPARTPAARRRRSRDDSAGARRPARCPRPPARMTVTGRVLDPDGKPVRGRGRGRGLAAPHALGRRERGDLRHEHALLGQGQSDGDGRFRLDAPRTASIRVFEVYAMAAAPGYGLGWAELNPDAEQPAADIRLRPEQLIRVRLVDVTGRPAAGRRGPRA